MKRLNFFILLILLSGCYFPGFKKEQNYALLETNTTINQSETVDQISKGSENTHAEQFDQFMHNLSSQLLHNLNGTTDLQGPIAVTTFVDLNDLYRTSPFGRYIAEGLMGELQRSGLMVTEIRKTESILIKERFGEYSLSRNIKEISKHSSAEYLLVGTYIVRGDHIFVNARIISNKNNLVVSSAQAHLMRNSFLDRMLWPSAAPDVSPVVTIPIKSLSEESNVEIIPAGS